MTKWKSTLFFALLFGFVAVGVVQAAEIGGTWTKMTYPDANNITVFYEELGKVKAVGQARLEGHEVLWFGEGEIKNGQVRLHYHYSADTMPTGWEPNGTMDLKLSEDGKTLRGTGRSASGNWSGPIEFRRVQILLAPSSVDLSR